ncbi:hypothetical protein [uncultured Kordia sp.]|uniref:hypothetical protein n=1 Tax=uncultured Kordia sp. TaxID=507699 RepID=UPI00262ACE1E|nr:hypothetical protein [uncultured Kordia sp.]
MDTILSSKYNEFIAQKNHEFPSLVAIEKAAVPKILKQFHYPISSWPVLIEKEIVKEIKLLSVRIPKLIAKIPELYFNNDIQRIADFYVNGNKTLAEFTMMCQEKQVLASCRLDIVNTNKGLKVLEANICSSIGGWQLQSFEKEIRSYHPLLKSDIKKEKFISRNTQVNYIKFIINEILNNVYDIDKEINIFISLDDEEAIAPIDTVAFFQNLIDVVNEEKEYKIKIFTGDVTKLYLEGKNLHFNSVRIHGLLDMDIKEIPSIVTRAFLLGTTYFPDNLATNMHSDKRNLALLRLLAEAGKFTATDNRLLKNCMPWTVELQSKEVNYKEEKIAITELIKEKDKFVIKPFRGFQGKEVFVGKFLTQTQWEAIVKKNVNSGKFILQEFCDSKQYLAPNKNNEWTPHKIIWGTFGFGTKYAGTFVRMSEVTSNRGVINAATGAIETIVYEVL